MGLLTWVVVFVMCLSVVEAIPRQCAAPAAITNGGYNPVSRQYKESSIVYFTCNLGFRRSGPYSATCRQGIWDNSIPSCTPVNCGDPGTPRNGWRSVTGFNYGNVVTYHCYSMYMLMGSKTRTCGLDGKWSGSMPFCSD